MGSHTPTLDDCIQLVVVFEIIDDDSASHGKVFIPSSGGDVYKPPYFRRKSRNRDQVFGGTDADTLLP
jgi:hypothetical protein